MHSTPPPFPNVPPVIRSQPPSIPKQKVTLPWFVKLVIAICVLIVGFVAFTFISVALNMKKHPRTALPGEAEFRVADHEILLNHGTVAFGNNAEAVVLAGDFSRGLKRLRESFFTEGKKDAWSASKGEFLTYCRLNEDSCVFLVHVPELRRFTSDAKTSLVDLAWMSAQSAVARSNQPPPQTVVVGVKGAILYEAILIGTADPDSKSGGYGIRTRGKGIEDLKLFYPYFTTSRQLTNTAAPVVRGGSFTNNPGQK